MFNSPIYNSTPYNTMGGQSYRFEPDATRCHVRYSIRHQLVFGLPPIPSAQTRCVVSFSTSTLYQTAFNGQTAPGYGQEMYVNSGIIKVGVFFPTVGSIGGESVEGGGTENIGINIKPTWGLGAAFSPDATRPVVGNFVQGLQDMGAGFGTDGEVNIGINLTAVAGWARAFGTPVLTFTNNGKIQLYRRVTFRTSSRTQFRYGTYLGGKKRNRMRVSNPIVTPILSTVHFGAHSAAFFTHRIKVLMGTINISTKINRFGFKARGKGMMRTFSVPKAKTRNRMRLSARAPAFVYSSATVKKKQHKIRARLNSRIVLGSASFTLQAHAQFRARSPTIKLTSVMIHLNPVVANMTVHHNGIRLGTVQVVLHKAKFRARMRSPYVQMSTLTIDTQPVVERNKVNGSVGSSIILGTIRLQPAKTRAVMRSRTEVEYDQQDVVKLIIPASQTRVQMRSHVRQQVQLSADRFAPSVYARFGNAGATEVLLGTVTIPASQTRAVAKFRAAFDWTTIHRSLFPNTLQRMPCLYYVTLGPKGGKLGSQITAGLSRMVGDDVRVINELTDELIDRQNQGYIIINKMVDLTLRLSYQLDNASGGSLQPLQGVIDEWVALYNALQGDMHANSLVIEELQIQLAHISGRMDYKSAITKADAGIYDDVIFNSVT